MTRVGLIGTRYADYWNRQLCEVENSSVISMR